MITIEENTQKISINGESIDLFSPESFSIISKLCMKIGWANKYSYQFSWMGRPLIQLPEDVIRAQELIFKIKPSLIIETGIAHGGSLVFYASLLKALGKGRVVGIDIDIRDHNREAIEAHSLYTNITLIEGSSTDSSIISRVENHVREDDTVLVILDSCHSKEHVLNELNIYSKLVSIGSYVVATDGIMKEVAGAPRSEEDWSWNNPQEAVKEFLKENGDFVLDTPKPNFNESSVDFSPTYWPNAYLKRVR